jgi:glucose-1-phosphate adenylyltransferase
MGIYVFSASKLYKYLEEDSKNENSSNDFGKDILPTMLSCGEKMMAYEFSGYWKDVGTIDSLYDANMDLLGDNPAFDINDSSWKIQSRSPLAPPHFLGDEGKVNNSIIMSGCEIFGTVENSVLSSDVIVKKGAVVKNSIIMSDVVVGENSVVNYAIIDENTKLGKGAKVGEDLGKKKKITVLGRNINVIDGAEVPAGQIVDQDVIKGDK